MTLFDPNLLPDFLRGRRWFGGKGLPIKHVRVLEQVTIGPGGEPPKDGEGFALAVLEVSYELGHPERYLAPVMTAADGRLIEALDNDELACALFLIVRDEKQIPAGGSTLKGEVVGNPAVLQTVSDSPRVRRIAAEQSNTSLVFDEKVILKLIRKLDFGHNPEWEMGQFLRKRGFRYTPPLLGGIVLEGELLSTVAVVHEFVQVESDGWAWMLEQLREPSPSQDALGEVRKLGERLGELHAVLASDSDDPAFAPEPIGSEDLQRWASSITGELGTTINAATRKLPDLALRRDALVERIQRMAVAPPSGMKIRIHGDLHLGQTLRTGGEWLIFDFEGEPSRPFVMRREKYMPLRDVAGMLRSFAYACATVELEGAPEGERLAPVRRAFLEGYRARVPAELLPSDEGSFNVMLETMELEKLLYELRYEVNHRPDWVKIPARVLMEMCAEPESSGSSQPPEPPTAPA